MTVLGAAGSQSSAGVSSASTSSFTQRSVTSSTADQGTE